ncbi:Tolloid-like protein 1, partial [Elysia marginata]
NCGWERRKTLTTDDQSYPVEISNYSYGNNKACRTEITYQTSSRSSRHLLVTVSFFNLQGSSATGHACLAESERLTFQMETSKGLKNVTWCGQLYAEKHVYPTSRLTIIYNSGQIGQGTGFQLKVSLVLVNSHAGQNFLASDQPRLLYSPKYPENHDDLVRDYSVTLEGKEGNFILIRILMINLEQSRGINCFDYLLIGQEKFCGTSRDHEAIVVRGSTTVIYFNSDRSLNKEGYILEYSSYKFGRLSDASEPHTTCTYQIGPVPRLFQVEDLNEGCTFTAEDDSHTLRFEFIERTAQPFSFIGSDIFFSDSNKTVRFRENLKHYWSKGNTVEVHGIFMPNAYFLVQSVQGKIFVHSFEYENSPPPNPLSQQDKNKCKLNK